MINQDDMKFAEEFGETWLDGSITAKTVLATKLATHREQSTRELVEALRSVFSDCQLAQDALGNSPSQFDSVRKAFGIVASRAHLALTKANPDA